MPSTVEARFKRVYAREDRQKLGAGGDPGAPDALQIDPGRRSSLISRGGASACGEVMEIGFFFWPYTPELVRRMGEAADRYGYDMIGAADTPGNAMDPWVAATMLAQSVARGRIAHCVTNLSSRHPAVSAAGIASLI